MDEMRDVWNKKKNDDECQWPQLNNWIVNIKFELNPQKMLALHATTKSGTFGLFILLKTVYFTWTKPIMKRFSIYLYWWIIVSFDYWVWSCFQRKKNTQHFGEQAIIKMRVRKKEHTKKGNDIKVYCAFFSLLFIVE